MIYVEGTNRHHVFFPRRTYKTRIERSLRNNPLMIIRMDIEAHKELHAKVSPPLKLDPEQMMGVLTVMDSLETNLQPHERLLELADYLSDRERREQRVAQNLRLQAGFIEGGYGTAG